LEHTKRNSTLLEYVKNAAGINRTRVLDFGGIGDSAIEAVTKGAAVTIQQLAAATGKVVQNILTKTRGRAQTPAPAPSTTSRWYSLNISSTEAAGYVAASGANISAALTGNIEGTPRGSWPAAYQDTGYRGTPPANLAYPGNGVYRPRETMTVNGTVELAFCPSGDQSTANGGSEYHVTTAPPDTQDQCVSAPAYTFGNVNDLKLGVCRLYMYTSPPDASGSFGYERSTAWFIGDDLRTKGDFIMMTAGHSVAVGGSLGNDGHYVGVNINNETGLVCCSPSFEDSPNTCAPGSKLAVRLVSASQAWIQGNDDGTRGTESDAAAMFVQSYEGFDESYVGRPLFEAYTLDLTPQVEILATYAGFPVNDNERGAGAQPVEGCAVDWDGGQLVVTVDQTSYPTPVAFSGDPLTFYGPACRGVSGGPLASQFSTGCCGGTAPNCISLADSCGVSCGNSCPTASAGTDCADFEFATQFTDVTLGVVARAAAACSDAGAYGTIDVTQFTSGSSDHGIYIYGLITLVSKGGAVN
jgi:hypothetical protein